MLKLAQLRSIIATILFTIVLVLGAQVDANAGYLQFIDKGGSREVHIGRPWTYKVEVQCHGCYGGWNRNWSFKDDKWLKGVNLEIEYGPGDWLTLSYSTRSFSAGASEVAGWSKDGMPLYIVVPGYAEGGIKLPWFEPHAEVSVPNGEGPFKYGEDVRLEAKVTGLPGLARITGMSGDAGGLSFNGTDLRVGGRASIPGTSTYTLKITDAWGWTVESGEFKIKVLDPDIWVTIKDGKKVSATYGKAIDPVTFEASRGISPYTYTLEGKYPRGLKIDASTGVLSGTPTESGTFTFSVRATDANRYSNVNGISVTIAPPSITISPETLSNGKVGVDYSQTISASGGIAPYKYRAGVNTSPPAGLSINETTGELSGKPRKAGTYTFWLGGSDVNNQGANSDETNGWRFYTVEIAPPDIKISVDNTNGNLPVPVYNQVYSAKYKAEDGIAPYKWSVASGELPAGLSLNADTGELTGTVKASGSFSFKVQATDAEGYTKTRDESFTIAAPEITLDLSQLVDGKEGLVYGPVQVTAGGGAEPYSYSFENLPEGLTQNADGTVTGTPTKAGAASVKVTVTDKHGTAVSQTKEINIKAAPDIWVMIREKSELVTAVYGQAIEARTFYAENGTEPYTFSLEGSVPPGLTLDSATGVLSGTPTQTGTFNFDVRATDKDSYSNTHSNSVTVSADIKVTVDSAGGQLPVPVYN
ncbi:putative Ig domain-containing protein, partial [Brucella intermedia]|uniref:putative Ig domain-containing protein n=1 Tax=Brucella TaxID=234 RepID=UPI003B97FE27